MHTAILKKRFLNLNFVILIFFWRKKNKRKPELMTFAFLFALVGFCSQFAVVCSVNDLFELLRCFDILSFSLYLITDLDGFLSLS